MLTLVLLFLGSFADHLLSEHTPFTVTVLHPLELDHYSFFHSLRSLQLLGTASHVVLTPRSPGLAPLVNDDWRFTQDEICTTGGGEGPHARIPSELKPRHTQSAFVTVPAYFSAVWAKIGAGSAGQLEPEICVPGAGAGGAPGARVILLRGGLGIRRLSAHLGTPTPHFTGDGDTSTFGYVWLRLSTSRRRGSAISVYLCLPQ
ncbi:hypothetical protein B0H13DRAFT_1875472 [Mycena leptocephala]|nr:hypothetical protein B0H13DRAFT_1875472 [Mycena leptocephala]